MLSFKPIYYSFLNFSCLKTNPGSLWRMGEGWPGPQALNPLSSCRSDCSQPHTFYFTAQRELAVWVVPRRFHLRPASSRVSHISSHPGIHGCAGLGALRSASRLVPLLGETPPNLLIKDMHPSTLSWFLTQMKRNSWSNALSFWA